MKWDNSDYGIPKEEFSSSKDQTESDFENLFCPLSLGEKYTCHERTFLVYESSLRELLTSCARCGSCINHNLIKEIKNTRRQLTLHIEYVKGNFNFLIKGAFLRVRLVAQNDGFVFKQCWKCQPPIILHSRVIGP